jgi:hypothetical protein
LEEKSPTKGNDNAGVNNNSGGNNTNNNTNKKKASFKRSLTGIKSF